MENNKLKIYFRHGAAMILALLILISCGSIAFAVDTEPEKDHIFAAYPGDKLPLYDGSFVDVDEGAIFAVITRDRNYLVTWFDDGRLILRDLKNDREALLSEDCTSLVDVRDGGLLYTNGEGNSYRVLFENASRLNLGKTLKMKLAENSMSLLYADAYDNVLALPENEKEPTVLSVWDREICLDGISDNGELAVWTEIKGGKSSICMSDSGKKTVLTELDSKYCGTWVQFSADEKLMLVASNYSDRMWLKQSGKMLKHVYLGDEAWHDDFYCDEGRVENFNAEDIDYVYASGEAQLYNNVLRLRMNGHVKPILEEVLLCGITGGRILYLTEDDLYAATIKEGEISGEKKLSDNASLARISPDGEYACYFEDLDDSVGRLVCCSLKDGNCVTVTENAAGLSKHYFEVSPDGKSIFFYKDAKYIENMEEYAELWMWSRDDKEVKLIDQEVIIGSLSSGLVEGVERDNFSYVKYLGTDAEGNIIGTFMYYDGETTVIDDEIIYG